MSGNRGTSIGLGVDTGIDPVDWHRQDACRAGNGNAVDWRASDLLADASGKSPARRAKGDTPDFIDCGEFNAEPAARLFTRIASEPAEAEKHEGARPQDKLLAQAPVDDKPRFHRFKGLFNQDKKTGQQADTTKMSKVEFGDRACLVEEMMMPSAFKPQPRDADVPADPAIKEYSIPGSSSRILICNGREVPPELKDGLADVLKKKGQGPLAENSKEFETACGIIGGGYHSFLNDPKITVGTFNGKDAIILRDEDPQEKMTGYTVFIPSADKNFVHTVSFDGRSSDFAAVQKGFASIKWRTNTIDSVPAPAPR